jgi:hypothetical protein
MPGTLASAGKDARRRVADAIPSPVISWCRTPDGWAVNLDGTNAVAEFSLPRIELQSGPKGWTCICHRKNGTMLKLQLGAGVSARAAKHTAVEATLALGTQYDAQLLALLGRPGA